MLESKTLETIVGLFVALGLGALFILAMKVSNLSRLWRSRPQARRD